jgi:hypothetical protein
MATLTPVTVSRYDLAAVSPAAPGVDDYDMYFALTINRLRARRDALGRSRR